MLNSLVYIRPMNSSDSCSLHCWTVTETEIVVCSFANTVGRIMEGVWLLQLPSQYHFHLASGHMTLINEAKRVTCG